MSWLVMAAVGGCPWVGSDEHRARQDTLFTMADADADVDADADADVLTGTTADTSPPPCVEDAFEPNDDLPTATEAMLPSTLQGILCPSPVLDTPTDVFRVTTEGATQTLQVAVQDVEKGGSCADLQLLARVTGPDLDALYTHVVSDGSSCPTLTTGRGPGVHHVVLTALGDGPQPYRLALQEQTCVDADKDGWLDAACGGEDCNDAEMTIGPGSTDVAADGLDADCDGGDELADSPLVEMGDTPVIGELDCGDPRTDDVWDGWEVFADVGQLVQIAVDNGKGQADLVAHVVDADGSSHFGWADGSGQLDDDAPCSTTPWTKGGCPARSVVTNATSGPNALTIWVSQKGGSGCIPSGYEMTVRVGSESVVPTLVIGGNDARLPWPR